MFHVSMRSQTHEECVQNMCNIKCYQSLANIVDALYCTPPPGPCTSHSATHYVRGTERSTYRPQWRNTMRGTWTRRRSTIESIHNICQTLIALNVTHVLYTFLVCLRPHTDVKHDTLLLLFCQSLDYFHDSYC